MTSTRGTVVIVATEDWFLALHWLPLIRAAIGDGWQVFVAARVRHHGDAISSTGATLIPLGLARESRNPWNEIASINELTALYRRLRPDVVHHIAMKPVLYGSWAARRAAVPRVINTFPGLGHLYVRDTYGVRVQRAVLERILRTLFRRPGTFVQVQNTDDAKQLAGAVIESARLQNIGGVGVALDRFVVQPERTNGIPTVVFPARMLIDKGVIEFVAAARVVRERGMKARFLLAGDTDSANPAAVPESQLRAWASEGTVEWLGHRDDMPSLVADAALIVLPSFYREGVPKSLQEAAATGRAIVTTDVPGCRDAVRDGWNGRIVPPRDVNALANAIIELLSDPALRATMGKHGRELAESTFDDRHQALGMIAHYR